MVKDYGEILLESMSTLLNAGLQTLAKPTSETEEEKKVREEKLLTTTDPFTNFFPNYTKTITPAADTNTLGKDGTLSEFWPISINSKKNNLLAVECVISTARIVETETEEEVKYQSVSGTFGIMIGVQFEDKTKVYHLTSDDMFGNIYNFKQMPQKIILNLPEDVDMKSIAFTAYNKAAGLTFTLHSITLSLGEDLNAIGPTLEPFEISCIEADPKVMIGEDEDGELTALSDTDYHLEARYVGKDANDNYYVVSPNNTTNWPIGLMVRWYKFKAGVAASDAWGGAEWEYLAGRDGLALTCPISELLDEEPDSYKAVLIGFDDTIGKQVNLVSNTVSIDKESLPTAGPITKIGIEFQDRTKGNYPYYDLDNYICPSLMHQTVVKRNAVCKITTPYISEEDGTILPTFFNKVNYIEWIYDPKSIQQVDITESATFECESYFDTNGYNHCRFKNFNGIANTSFDNLCCFTYLIPSRLSVNDIEDKLACKFVFKDGREYEASRPLSFTQRGNNGTDYTVIARLFNEADQVINVVPIGAEGRFYINVDVYDPEGKRLDLSSATITMKNASDETGIAQYDNDTQKWWLINPGSNTPLVCEISIKFGATENSAGTVIERIIYLKDYLFIPKCEPAYGDRIYKGPTKIVYNSEGVHPEYNNSFLELLSTDSTASVSWSLNSSIVKPTEATDPDFTSLNPEITLSAGKYSFTPVGTFDARLESSVMSLEAYAGTTVIWKQPIKFIQNKHFSSIIDGWDGSLQIDEDGNYIMASAYVAGGKNDENEFTGLVMGQLGAITETKETVATVTEGETTEATKPNYKNSHETTPIAKETGLFGYKEGAQSFGFRADGTAFIGPSGGGRINFDGNGGVIYSGNFDGFEFNQDGTVFVDTGTKGTYFNLQDGKLITSEGMFRGALGVEEGNLAGWKLDWSGLYKQREYEIPDENGSVAYSYYMAGISSNTSVPILQSDTVFSFSSKNYYTVITGDPGSERSNVTTWRIPHRINGQVVGGLEASGSINWNHLPQLQTVQFDSDITSLFIGDEFFKGNQTIKKVYIPASTYYVGSNVFDNMSSDLEIYLEGGLNPRWASNWYGNANTNRIYYSQAQDFNFSDIKFVETATQAKLIRFYAGVSTNNPTIENDWVKLPANRNVFLVADSGEAFMSDASIKRCQIDNVTINKSANFGTPYRKNPDTNVDETATFGEILMLAGNNALNLQDQYYTKYFGTGVSTLSTHLAPAANGENATRLHEFTIQAAPFLVKAQSNNTHFKVTSNQSYLSTSEIINLWSPTLEISASEIKLTKPAGVSLNLPSNATISLMFGEDIDTQISLDKTGAYYFKQFMDNIQNVVAYLESNDVIN